MAGGRPIRADGIQIGTSPRFTAITADTVVRRGDGIFRAITITGAAGGVIDIWEGTVGTGTQLMHIPATTGPGTYWADQSFSGDLHIVIATAVTDLLVLTGGE